MSNESRVWQAFDTAMPHYRAVVERLLEPADVDRVMGDARSHFAGMVPHMAYREAPDHPMASAVFFCSTALAVYLAAEPHGVDAHRFGAAMLAAMKASPPPPAPPDAERDRARRAAFVDAADASLQHAAPGEFVFEAVSGRGEDFDWGINIHSCAICHAFSRYDAMDLVPYMCATDDVTSDWGDEGLERSGTIAVGAHRCDFRFRQGRRATPLAELYPERIRLTPREGT